MENKKGRFGIFGGQYVPELLMPALDEMEAEYENIYVKQEFVKDINPPMAEGTYIGNIKMYLGDEEIYSKDIYTSEKINKKGIGQYFQDGLKRMFKETSILDIKLVRYTM
jgi:tryptophan synthase beta subunit